MNIPEHPVAAFFRIWAESLENASFAQESPDGSASGQRSFDGPLFGQDLFTYLTQAAVDLVNAFSTDDSGEKSTEAKSDAPFQPFLNFYQQTVGSWLGLPHLGLAREHTQKLSAAMDAYGQFVAVMMQFAQQFAAPFTASMHIFAQTIAAKAQTGEHLDGRSLYNQLVEIMDAQYDHFLKSPQGIEGVTTLVDKYLDYEKELKEVKALWARGLSLPTPQEMEEVYHNIYLLKKRSRTQAKMIAQQAERIDQLNRQMESLAKRVSKGKSQRAPKTAQLRAKKPKPKGRSAKATTRA
jgi:DNA-dependent RNA polymerase auxiliary subunit epsilon